MQEGVESVLFKPEFSKALSKHATLNGQTIGGNGVKMLPLFNTLEASLASSSESENHLDRSLTGPCMEVEMQWLWLTTELATDF